MFIAAADATPGSKANRAAASSASCVDDDALASAVLVQEPEIQCDLLWLGRLLCFTSALVTITAGALAAAHAFG